MMTTRLEAVFSEAAKLSESDQDALAAWILEELDGERQWQAVLAESGATLESLADEALAEHRARRTRGDPRSPWPHGHEVGRASTWTTTKA